MGGRLLTSATTVGKLFAAHSTTAEFGALYPRELVPAIDPLDYGYHRVVVPDDKPHVPNQAHEPVPQPHSVTSLAGSASSASPAAGCLAKTAL